MSLNNALELIGAVLGLTGVWLASANSASSWWFQLSACLIYTWIFYQSHLLADSLLQIWFFCSSLYGLWNWRDTRQQTLPISSMVMRDWLPLLLTNLLGVVLLYALLSPSGQARWLGLDALCAVLSVTAQRLLVRRKIENWLFWIIVNSLYLWIYWQSQLYYTWVFYVVLLILAIRAWWQWRELLNQVANVPS